MALLIWSYKSTPIMQKTSVLFHFCKSPLAQQLAHALIICRLGEFANPSWPRCFCCQADSAAHHASDRRRHRVGRGRPSAPSTHGQISVPYHTPPKVSPLQFYWVRFFCERFITERRARVGASSGIAHEQRTRMRS
jgi:hypothetical protein